MDTFIFFSFVVIIVCGAVLLGCSALLMQHHEEQNRSLAEKRQRLSRRWSDRVQG
ncbi:hypothetical protein [Salinarimonas soli]|uniref:hypothetical protein n=1 Tax=Salinarimonas soli TaxID=1638099 RepID=UPI001661E32B|nr:hypothetical protein [Salinarimonas soli]